MRIRSFHSQVLLLMLVCGPHFEYEDPELLRTEGLLSSDLLQANYSYKTRCVPKIYVQIRIHLKSTRHPETIWNALSGSVTSSMVCYVVKATYLDSRPETLISVMRSLLFTNRLSRGKKSFLVQEKSLLSLYFPKFICLIEHKFYRTLLQVAGGGREDIHIV